MLSARHAITAAVLVAWVSRSVSATAAPCSTSETAQLDALAESLGGLLHVCKTDSGFDLYPFKGFPPSDKTTIVCFGRSCPSVIYNLRQATLPDCTVDVLGKAMTPDEYLTALCPIDGAAPTPAPNTTTTTPTTPTPGGATTTPTTTTPGATTTKPSTTTPPASATSAPTETTPAPSETENDTAGSSSASSTGDVSPSVETPGASKDAASTPTKAPTTPPASGAASPLAAASALLLTVATQMVF